MGSRYVMTAPHSLSYIYTPPACVLDFMTAYDTARPTLLFFFFSWLLWDALTEESADELY